jgi:hypothetical protein
MPPAPQRDAELLFRQPLKDEVNKEAKGDAHFVSHLAAQSLNNPY